MGKPANKKKKNSETNESRLSKFRPSQRLIFFIFYACFCLWLVVFDEHCNVKGQRRDCGWPGISVGLCRAGACFFKGGGSMSKKVIKVKRKKGTTLGLRAVPDDEGGWALVKGIDSGAVEAYNAELPPDSDERITPYDSVAKVDGRTGAGILKALEATSEQTVEIELRKTALPVFLKWIRTSAKANFVEKVLTAPGFVRWFGIKTRIEGVGFFCWFLSGYPLASIPMYMAMAWGVAWNSVRCCYEVTSGAHCYKGNPMTLEKMITKSGQDSLDLAQRVSADPKGYMEWLFIPSFD